MITDTPRGSAKIYQFPIRPRRTAGGYRDEAKPEIRTPIAAAVAVGSGWYHDAAIQESKRSSER